jgi:hypothetical protein
MNFKSTLDKIRELIAAKDEVANQTEETNEVVNESEFAPVDVKTDDNRILRVTDLATDGAVTEITEEGEVAVEDGTYVLEDGKSIVVEAGIIKEVIEAAPASEEAPADAPASEEMAEEIPAEGAPATETEIEVETEDSSVEDRIAALEEAVKMLLGHMETMMSEKEKAAEAMEAIKAENEALKEANENLSKVPAAEPVKTAKFEKVIGASASEKKTKVNTELLSKISALRESK